MLLEPTGQCQEPQHTLTRTRAVQAGLAWGILSDWGWRWLVAISSVPLLLLMLLYPLLPESPYWLLAMGRTQEVQAMLSRIARINGRDLPPGRLQPAAAHKARVRRGWAKACPCPLSPGYIGGYTVP